MQKLVGKEPTTWIYCVLAVLVYFVPAFLLQDQVGSPLWWACAYFVGATVLHSSVLGVHEVCHYLAFKSQFLNRCLILFTGLPVPIPYAFAFREYHLEHHKAQGTEGVDTDLPTSWEARNFKSIPGKFLYLFTYVYWYLLRPVIIRPKFMWTKPWFVADFCATYSLFYYLYANYFNAFLYFGACFLLFNVNPCAGHFLAEHTTFDDATETYSYYGMLNKLTFNVGYHNEHHDFPGIPWSRLPELRKIAPEFYNNLPCHQSWAWVMISFVIDGKTCLFNRVKRGKNKAE